MEKKYLVGNAIIVAAYALSIIAALLSLNVHASEPLDAEHHHWTNTASAPSRLRYRGLGAMYSVMKKMSIPRCAVEGLALRVMSGDGHLPLYIANHVIYDAVGRAFSTSFDMSFYRGGDDYVDRGVTPNLAEPTTGDVYYYQCDGHDVYIGYHPKCQNIFVLNYIGETNEKYRDMANVYSYLDERLYRDRAVHSIPTPPSALLIISAGLIGIIFLKRRQAE